MSEDTIIHHGVTIQIIQDEDPQSPRDWDNLGTMFCAHGRYDLGDKQFHSAADLDAALEAEGKMAVILPLYLYDHSGITIRTTPFSCPWDSGMVGYVFVTKEKARKEWGKLTAATLKKIKDCLVSEIDAYDKYLTGEVYGYIVDEEGENESSWGFYGGPEGSYEYCLGEAKAVAERIAAKRPSVYMSV